MLLYSPTHIALAAFKYALDAQARAVELTREFLQRISGVDETHHGKEYESHLELILYGSLKEAYKEQFYARLSGLCDKGYREFHEHELSFSLKVGGPMSMGSDVTVRLRREFHSDAFHPTANKWHMRYIGTPEPIAHCPVIVRKVIDSVVSSNNMMEFVKSLGLRMDYEYITKGRVYTNGGFKVIVNDLRKTETPGKYEQGLKPISTAESLLIEVATSLPESADYDKEAKMLRAFADQLRPLVKMEKIDYWKK
ncbi:unnamed protein product, partial [Mesorhabditis spiculigera]